MLITLYMICAACFEQRYASMRHTLQALVERHERCGR